MQLVAGRQVPNGMLSRFKRFEEIKEIVRKNAIPPISQALSLQIKYPDGSTSAALSVDPSKLLTPMQVYQQLLPSNIKTPKNLMVARLNGNTLWDLSRPLEKSAMIELLDFDSDDGKKVFWHSSAHVLGQALEIKYGDSISLCDGPPLSEGGFFYEMLFHDSQTASTTDFADINSIVKAIVKQKQPFERLEVTKDIAADLFKDNKMKIDMLHKIPDTEPITLYRNGPFVDLCRGPHVSHSGKVAAFEATRCGASHGQNKEDDAQLLQRVYGIAFPQKPLMKEWKVLQEEAKKRDHRVIGRDQGLFMFHPVSPGSSFMLPHGARVFNKLVEYIRSEYQKRGYDEVVTPLMYKTDLWETSGHLENYRDDMFMIHDDDSDDESSSFGLKPMNCPGHCIIFKESRSYSYRDLPVRLADFSALHRNEATGALSGLTRVRRFHQDDAHIFCGPEHVQSEISDCLDFVKSVYGVFGFEFNLRLSTRPEKFMGKQNQWDDAESQLTQALNAFGKPWELKEGDGAFYGPKIDIEVTDALKRRHQCATIQLDFQLPERFNLSYVAPNNVLKTPIIIHRAVLGSIERIMAVLIEHTGGKFPLWLSPRQVALVPVTSAHTTYATDVAKKLRDDGFYVDVSSLESKTLNKRIRECQMSGYNYILVVGDKELEEKLVNVRTRDNVVHGTKSIIDFMTMINEERKAFK